MYYNLNISSILFVLSKNYKYEIYFITILHVSNHKTGCGYEKTNVYKMYTDLPELISMCESETKIKSWIINGNEERFR